MRLLISILVLAALASAQADPPARPVFHIGGGVSAPILVHKVEPKYSEEARRAKWQGTVRLSAIIDEDGSPSEVKVFRSPGLGLDENAIDAVKSWRFKPGKKDAKPVRVIVSIDVTFRLPDEPPQAGPPPQIAPSDRATASFSGTSAFEFTKQSVDFGPRPSGSEANRKLQAFIISELKKDDCELIDDSFNATTPRGSVPMKNIIAKFPGKSGKAIVIAGHFDTKLFPGRKFVGANDGGSSTGLLLELAHVLAHQPRVDDVYVVFFDGEEAVGEWSDTDSVYGSKHLAARWKKDGLLPKVKAFILVDMIGDKSLDIKREPTGNAKLTSLVWKTAADLGYAANFLNDSLDIEDDHLPFVKLGVPAIDIIDFDYPPWHTDGDTMDKIGAQSLEIVGTVVVETIHRLEQ